MHVAPLQSRPLIPPHDDVRTALVDALGTLGEQSVIAISSKVVAIGEGRCVSIPDGEDPIAFKDALVARESELFIPRDRSAPNGRAFTITDGTLISSAGIDRSNGNGYLILWPEDPMSAAASLRTFLMEHFQVAVLGVLITDSAGAPLRNGVRGITIGYAGFHAQCDYRGTPDIFGRLLAAERLNVADSLAATAVLAMGEGKECTPFVCMTDIPHITFTSTESDDPYLTLKVSREHDVFATFFDHAPWQKGGRHE